jgi:hypothetical protein
LMAWVLMRVIEQPAMRMIRTAYKQRLQRPAIKATGPN